MLAASSNSRPSLLPAALLATPVVMADDPCEAAFSARGPTGLTKDYRAENTIHRMVTAAEWRRTMVLMVRPEEGGRGRRGQLPSRCTGPAGVSPVR
jgi:hypothetical protein